MLQPVRTKYRKAFKGRIHGKASRAVKLNYGQFGLKAMEPERIIGKQIEAARVALTRYMKRTGKVWTRIFPNIPVSKKPTEVRMGKGKGAPEYYACRVKPGRIIFEVDGVTEEIARVALTRYMKRTGKVWTRIFPNIPVSKKPTEVRMGKGKGSPEYYACRVKPGRIIFEVDGVTEEIAKEALYKASAKLPIKTKFVKR